MEHQPLKITFKVQGGWAPPPYPFHLDALLAYCVTQRDLYELEDDPTPETLRRLGENLPLAKHEQDGEWVWKASAIRPSQPVLNDSGFYTQRRDLAAYAHAVKKGDIQHSRYQPGTPLKPDQYKLDTMRGVHRNLLGFYPVERPAEGAIMTLQAWCVGDHALIEEMLTDDRRPTHLGSRRRSGLGRIVAVSVEVDAAALENWKLRVKPWKLIDADTPIQAAWRAPYWAAENRGKAYVPIQL